MVASGYGADDKVSKSGDTMTGTLTVEGSPPINVPGGTAGEILISDGSGNLTPQAPAAAAALQSATTTVTVSAATAPTNGQVLTATSSTVADWQTPSSLTSAASLETASAPVVVSAATAPSAGQVLTATSATAADWQTPSVGGDALVLPESSAPSPVGGSGQLYVDSSGNLWYLSPGGTATMLAND